MSYAVRKPDGSILGTKNTQADAERMAVYLTAGYGPLQVLNPEGQVVMTAVNEPSAAKTSTTAQGREAA